jgi:hypothetical protein
MRFHLFFVVSRVSLFTEKMLDYLSFHRRINDR